MAEAKRWKGQAEWDKEHMTTFGVKVRRDIGDEFRRLLQKNGGSANAVFRRAIDEYIANNKDKESSSD